MDNKNLDEFILSLDRLIKTGGIVLKDKIINDTSRIETIISYAEFLLREESLGGAGLKEKYCNKYDADSSYNR